MIDSFVGSLLSGKLFSGVDIKNKLDPIAVINGWNKVYDVSLPQIRLAVRDAADYTPPVTPNDHIFETIGSYAYREGLTYLPGPHQPPQTNIDDGQLPARNRHQLQDSAG
ncbi:hypothetical protein N656DRAFT_767708 [Canariomyces notabilis]|uniref:Uncharacterized protein n=1 Tax=Canariomyces notabilis TaxID=2074819 RepID=A0AAN6TF79_9PEZI|nr:hypothetical protein N656DRAFT_767708 [Canariomyces arenarius]